MMRRVIWVLVYLGWSGTALAAAEASAGPVCLYQSKAFSEGAFVCVQRSLMQVCASDGGRMIWKTVPDKDINDRCTAASLPHAQAEPRIHASRRHVLFRKLHPPVEAPAKCFVFMGRQYCE